MRAFQTGHEELIHDIKYDFYGRHVATASSDQHVKVFDLDAATHTWVLNDSWKAHDSSVVKLSWAHPEFSSSKILASCSYDRTVKLWQEMPDELQGSGRRWRRLATLAVESFGPIYDVQFAPSHLGLKLACVGSDGVVRVYESVEPADLSVWNLAAEIPILDSQLPAKSLQSSFCIEWCPAKFAQTEKFVVIALDQGFVFSTAPSGQNSAANQASGPSLGASLGTSLGPSLGPSEGHVGQSKRPQAYSGETSEPALAGLSGHPGLSGRPGPSGHLARSSDTLDEPSASSEHTARFVKVCSLPEHNGLIRSVSWAPSMGRSYHLLATGCKDGYIRIFKAHELGNGELKIDTVAKLNDHRQEVWRVEWNATGTILSSAGDDGKVRLWKCNYMNEWQCMSEINTSNRQDGRAATTADDVAYPPRPAAGR